MSILAKEKTIVACVAIVSFFFLDLYDRLPALLLQAVLVRRTYID